MTNERKYEAQLSWKSAADKEAFSLKKFLVSVVVFAISWVVCCFAYIVVIDNMISGADMSVAWVAVIAVLVSMGLHILALVIFLLLDIKRTYVQFLVVFSLAGLALLTQFEFHLLYLLNQLRAEEALVYFFPLIFAHAVFRAMTAGIRAWQASRSEQA